ncbi:MAG: potassium channel protein [Ignavibacteriales bacterium]|nr:potassium channel protein [Ignavibacteriales bacterium]
MENVSFRRMKIGLAVLVATILFGSAGYVAVEGFSPFDALYMTIITITTTGFKEVHYLSDAGRALTLVVLVAGLGSIGYSGGSAVFLIVESKFFWRRRMQRQIDALDDHYIICGYGRMGRAIARVLREAGVEFVAVESEETNVERIREQGFRHVHGDGTDDDVLQEAGVARAKGLVAVLANDAENVFVTLSAKVLNPDIYVVARAVEEETAVKLERAGADRVVKPYEVGGVKMAELLLRPGVTEFIDLVFGAHQVELGIEDVTVKPNSDLVGKTLVELPLRDKYNITVVAIYRSEGEFLYNPRSDARINANDRVVAIGGKEDLARFDKVCLGESNV